jgi:hypothetical protein
MRAEENGGRDALSTFFTPQPRPLATQAQSNIVVAKQHRRMLREDEVGRCGCAPWRSGKRLPLLPLHRPHDAVELYRHCRGWSASGCCGDRDRSGFFGQARGSRALIAARRPGIYLERAQIPSPMNHKFASNVPKSVKSLECLVRPEGLFCRQACGNCW